GGCTANIGFECDVVNKISGELETIPENQNAASQYAKLHNFIAETISTGDPEVGEVSLGDLHFSGEAIVGCANLTVQSGLSAGIHSDDWLQTRFKPNRSVGGIGSLLHNRGNVGLGLRSFLRNRD